MRSHEETKTLRIKLIEHLEAALGVTDAIGDSTSGYLIELAIDEVKSKLYPTLDPLYELRPKKNNPRDDREPNSVK